MIAALTKSFAQLDDPKIRSLLLWSALASLALLAGLVIGANYLLAAFSNFGWQWLNTLITWFGSIGAVILALLLFPAVLGITMSIFLDVVAEAVEARHYPHLPKAPGQSALAGLWTGIRFALVLIGVNLLLLFVWAILAVTVVLAPLVPALFFIVNGYLVGREYFETAAYRRYPAGRVTALRQAYSGRVWLAGIAIAVIASVPILNLLAPLLATAMMVHVSHEVAVRAGLEPPPPQTRVKP